MPTPSPEQGESIAQAALALNEARLNWMGDRTDKGRTLTALYNKKPTWLADAHRKLDDTVFAAYGWDAGMSDDALMEKLLALNLERVCEHGQ